MPPIIILVMLYGFFGFLTMMLSSEWKYNGPEIYHWRNFFFWPWYFAVFFITGIWGILKETRW